MTNPTEIQKQNAAAQARLCAVELEDLVAQLQRIDGLHYQCMAYEAQAIAQFTWQWNERISEELEPSQQVE